MSDHPAVSSAVSPWRTANRQALLDAFLEANLSRDEGVAWLRRLVGLGVTGSREYGRWVADPSKSDDEVGRDYADLQTFFRKVIELAGQTLLSARRTSRDPADLRALRRRLGRALDQLVDLLRDVRLDFVRESYEGGPSEHAELRRLLFMFGRTSTRRSPLALDLISDSLVGELALALADRLCFARWSDRCPICGDIWITPDGRGNRKLCGKTSCAAAWRQLTRRPEVPGSSTARVRQRRARAKRRTNTKR